MVQNVKNIRFFFYQVLEGENQHFAWARIWMLTLSSIIMINVLAIVLETIPSFAWAKHWFMIIEYFSLGVFTLEYCLRLWIAPISPAFISFFHTICKTSLVFYLFILFPYWISLLFSSFFPFEILVMFRIFRIFLFKKQFESITQIFSLIYLHRSTLINIFFLIFSTLLVASTAMYHAEHIVQPDKFASIVHTFYWAIITFATIGYGDIYPITGIGKIITSIIAMMGVLLYSLPTYIIGSAFYEEIKSEHAKERERLREKIKVLEAENKQHKAHIENMHHTNIQQNISL